MTAPALLWVLWLRRGLVVLAVLAPLLAVLVLLGSSANLRLMPGTGLQASEVELPEADAATSPDGFPRLLKDPIGRTLILPAPPVAIASAILAGDEMLSQLVPVQRVRTVTWLADDAGISNVAGVYPASLPRNKASIEELLAVQPDLAIVAAYSDASRVELLLNSGVPVLRFDSNYSYDDVRRNVRLLAAALGAERRAEQWLQRMNQRIEAVQQQLSAHPAPEPRVLYYNLSGSTSAPGTPMDETLRLAGGYNVLADTGITGYSRISPELAIALQPEVILMNDWTGGKGLSPVSHLMDDPAWQQVPAVRNNRVYGLKGAWLTSGTPCKVTGVEIIARLLHPQAFDGQRQPQPLCHQRPHFQADGR
ncbi:MAG: ABC transporter substrate-binding protein [Marinobacterium sp.]|nr:ABC transporter substrate-binding protein [Marinobacterium sp.]